MFTTTQSAVLGSRWDACHRRDIVLSMDAQGQYFLGGVQVPYALLLELVSLPQQNNFGDLPPREVPNERQLTIKQITPASGKVAAELRALSKQAQQTGWTVMLQ